MTAAGAAPPRTVAETATAVRGGTLAAVEVLAEHVALHHATHSALNALVQPRHEAARADAARIDAAAARAGLLAGVPVSMKDCFAVEGLATTLGLESRRRVIDAADAPLVARLRAAGAVIVGKANVPQALLLHETANAVWGRTNHPLRADRSPGGSSGGDAALVAAGVVPLGLGSDLAGSLRQPAHACGLVALLPRTATLGDTGLFDTMPHLQAVRARAGFLARTVADLGPVADALGMQGAADAAPTRVGWWDDAGPIPASPAIRRGVAEAVAMLRSAGAEIVPLDPALPGAAAWLHLALLSADGGADGRALLAGDPPLPGVRRLLRLARLPRFARPAAAILAACAGRRTEAGALVRTGPRRGAAVARLLARREALAARFAAAATGCDALVGPVSALPALRHGTAATLVLAAAPCLLANLLDLPAGSVPLTTVAPGEDRGRSWSVDPVLRAAAATDEGSVGLPVGVQVVAGPGRDESVVLGVMRLLAAAVSRSR